MYFGINEESIVYNDRITSTQNDGHDSDCLDDCMIVTAHMTA